MTTIAILVFLPFSILCLSQQTMDLVSIDARLEKIQEVAQGWPPKVSSEDHLQEMLMLWFDVERDLVELQDSFPSDFRLLIRLGTFYRMGHNLHVDGAAEKAVVFLEKASELSPGNPAPKMELGLFHVFTIEPGKGELELHESLELSGKNIDPLIYWGLAHAYYFQREFLQSKEYADRYLKHRPEDPTMQEISNLAKSALAGEIKPNVLIIEPDETEK